MGSHGDTVELVDADDVVLGERLRGGLGHRHESVAVLLMHEELIVRVDTDEPGLTVVQVVAALADVEIHDAYRVDLLHVAVLLTLVDVLRDGLRRPEEETLHEIQLAGVLDLYDDYLTHGVENLDIHAVVLLVRSLLVALALEDLHYPYSLTEEHRKEPLEHTEVRLLPQQALDGPVEPHVQVFLFSHNLCLT